MLPGLEEVLENSSVIFEVERPEFSPSSQVTFNLSQPNFADQKRSAMTATPEGICSTARTPAIFMVSAESTLETLPPKTGGRATTAKSMPGIFTSKPNCAVPFILEGVSRRRVDLPISVNFSGSFSGILEGGLTCDAASVSEP